MSSKASNTSNTSNTCKTCQVCCEKLNKTTRKIISCHKCDYDACTSCWKTYILGSVNDAKCMNCNEPWSPDVMDSTFSRSWRTKEYKLRRMEVLMDRERSQFPATLPAVAIAKQKKVMNAEVSTIQRELVHLKIRRYDLNTALDEGRDDDFNPNKNTKTKKTKVKQSPKAIEKIQEELYDIKNRINVLHERKLDLFDELRFLDSHDDDDKVPGKKAKLENIMCKCPAKGCNSFVMSIIPDMNDPGGSSSYAISKARAAALEGKCASCDTVVCSSCFEVKSGNDKVHACDPDSVATAKLIKKDCKACPSCATLIHRWQGCPMMWCTSCNTAFDWITGEIETRNIHNPHYTEYLARQTKAIPIRATGLAPVGNGNENIVNCNVIPCSIAINNHILRLDDPNVRDLIKDQHIIRRQMLAFNGLICHVDNIEIPNYNRLLEKNRSNEDLRMKFMMNEMTETEFKKEIIGREILNEKARVTRDILRMFVRVGIDCFYKILNTKTKTEIAPIANELDALLEYTVDCFAKQVKRFGSIKKPDLMKILEGMNKYL